MYKCYQGNIIVGVESFSLPWIILENLFYLSIWVLAGYLLWPLYLPFNLPILTILWVFLVLVIQILLKKHLCSGCYYYNKLCHMGWGKISSALFKQDSGNLELGMRLALFYIVPPILIFLSSLIFAIFKGVSLSYWLALAFYLLLNLLTFPLRKKGCALCAMHNVCPGSAA
jgi:hypothetical protein